MTNFDLRKDISVPRPRPVRSGPTETMLREFGVREVGILLLATSAALLYFLVLPVTVLLRLGVALLLITMGALFALGRFGKNNTKLEALIISRLFPKE
jgi:hypothetical protein